MPFNSSQGSLAERLVAAVFPEPQRLIERAGSWKLPARLAVHGPEVLLGSPALDWLEQALASAGHALTRTLDASAGAPIQLRLGGAPAAGANPDHAYRLALGEQGAVLEADSAAGLQHAVSTLVQLVTAAGSGPLQLPCLTLEDWPDFAQRGVMLDISRDRVPTLATLKGLIDALALWKVSQLQLYMEHTFAYAAHARVWAEASPLDASEVRELDAYCAARHLELVPNQNSFGHMHRWLRHEPYRALAECPDGFDHPWNWTGEPYGLCATDPRSLELLESLYDELLPNFQSRQLNVGLDETIDLGAGRSREACQARGTERVYLEFLQAVHARVRARGHIMQFWGDIIIHRPELIAELPRDALALEWGYEADHPFAEHLAQFQRAGLGFYVCPGTSSWCSIAGRSDNALHNIARAASAGKAAGAAGLLLTDWGDHGHLQPLAVSYLGFLAGAGLSWNATAAETPRALDLPGLLDRHAFNDSAGVLGRAAFELGNSYRHAGSLRSNASVLFWSLIKPERLLQPAGVTRASLEATLEHIERASSSLSAARPGTLGFCSPARRAAEGSRVRAELSWAADMLRCACHLGLARLAARDPESLASIGPEARAQLGLELDGLIERHRALWLERSRPGGLADSAARLERLRETLR